MLPGGFLVQEPRIGPDIPGAVGQYSSTAARPCLRRRSQASPRRPPVREPRADAAEFCQSLEPRRNIHTIPKDVTVLSDNVTLVDADAIVDAGIRRQASIAFGYLSLHFCCTAQSVDYAAELQQDAIAGGFDDPTSMFNQAVENSVRLSEPLRLNRTVGTGTARVPVS
jgi:hypothetical protein